MSYKNGSDRSRKGHCGVDAICGLSLVSVLSFVPRGRSRLRVLQFSPLVKSQHFKFQFDQESVRRRTTRLICKLLIVIFFIHSFIYLKNVQITNFEQEQIMRKEQVPCTRVKAFELFRRQVPQISHQNLYTFLRMAFLIYCL